MTEDEVELIYNYLHENYEYRDGELISVNNKGSRMRGSKAGNLDLGYKERNPSLLLLIKIKTKSYRLIFSHAIWIYHFRNKPRMLRHIDRNKMNNKIENLKETERSSLFIDNSDCFNGFTKVVTRTGKKKFRASIGINNKTIMLGWYFTEDEAQTIYSAAKRIMIENHNFNADELKEKIKKLFPWATIRKQNASKKYKGVTEDLRYPNKYTAEICVNYKRTYLGTYNTPEEAHAAYLKAKEEYARV